MLKELKKTGKKIIPITIMQMQHMCGNILELRAKDANIIVMSQTAYNNFRPQQKKQISKYGIILPIDIRTIETIGGGSARCMLGEVF
ncbi:MAG: arginine deiminase-related protein [Syntrophales bacterium]|nr:arginine deiminase-related protein [Syntrophales bacterium]